MPSQASSDQRDRAKVVPVVATSTTRQVSAAELAALLGQALPSAEAQPDASKRFRLLGVVAQVGGGAALVAMDDQPAKPYRLGSHLDEATYLQTVGPRHVVLGNSSSSTSSLRLELQPSDVRIGD